MSKNRFYIHRLNGKVTRLAMIGKLAGKFGAYGYVGGKWEFMPGLFKIENDVTADYEEISWAEAQKIMEEINSEA